MSLLSPSFLALYQKSPASKIRNASALSEAIFSSPRYRRTDGNAAASDYGRFFGTPQPLPNGPLCQLPQNLHPHETPPVRKSNVPGGRLDSHLTTLSVRAQVRSCTSNESNTSSRQADVEWKSIEVEPVVRKAKSLVTVDLECPKPQGNYAHPLSSHSADVDDYRYPCDSTTLNVPLIVEMSPPPIHNATNKRGQRYDASTTNQSESRFVDDFVGNTFVLKSWFVKPTGKSSVFIEGEMSDGSKCNEPRNSSSIVKRIDARTLQSKTGNIYKLVGSIASARALKSGLSQSFVSEFRNGFPENWKLVATMYHRARANGNKTIRSPVTSNSATYTNCLDLATLPTTRSGLIRFAPFDVRPVQRILTRADSDSCVDIQLDPLAILPPVITSYLSAKDHRNVNPVDDISELAVVPSSKQRQNINRERKGEQTQTTTMLSQTPIVELNRIGKFPDMMKSNGGVMIDRNDRRTQTFSKTFSEDGVQRGVTLKATNERKFGEEGHALRKASNVACQTDLRGDQRLLRSVACQTEMCEELNRTEWDGKGYFLRSVSAKNTIRDTTASRSPLREHCRPPLKKKSRKNVRKRGTLCRSPVKSIDDEKNTDTRYWSDGEDLDSSSADEIRKMSTRSAQKGCPHGAFVLRPADVNFEKTDVKTILTKDLKKKNVVIAGRDTLRFRRQFRDFVNVDCRDDDSDNDDVFSTTPYRTTCKLKGLESLRLDADDWRTYKDGTQTPQVRAKENGGDRDANFLWPTSAKKTPNLHSGGSPFLTADNPTNYRRKIDRYIWNRQKKKRKELGRNKQPVVTMLAAPPQHNCKTPIEMIRPLLSRVSNARNIDFGSEVNEEDTDADYYFSDDN